jgi:multidrug efflux pump subunit AcrB
VVFLPVAFMGGIVGRFMNSFGLTMASPSSSRWS